MKDAIDKSRSPVAWALTGVLLVVALRAFLDLVLVDLGSGVEIDFATSAAIAVSDLRLVVASLLAAAAALLATVAGETPLKAARLQLALVVGALGLLVLLGALALLFGLFADGATGLQRLLNFLGLVAALALAVAVGVGVLRLALATELTGAKSAPAYGHDAGGYPAQYSQQQSQQYGQQYGAYPYGQAYGQGQYPATAPQQGAQPGQYGQQHPQQAYGQGQPGLEQSRGQYAAPGYGQPPTGTYDAQYAHYAQQQHQPQQPYGQPGEHPQTQYGYAYGSAHTEHHPSSVAPQPGPGHTWPAAEHQEPGYPVHQRAAGPSGDAPAPRSSVTSSDRPTWSSETASPDPTPPPSTDEPTAGAEERPPA